MLMKWEDLEPGDVIILKKDFIEEYLSKCLYQKSAWFEDYKFQELIVSNVSKCQYLSDEYLIISFITNRINLMRKVQITLDGKFWDAKYRNNDVFEIVKLKDEEVDISRHIEEPNPEFVNVVDEEFWNLIGSDS